MLTRKGTIQGMVGALVLSWGLALPAEDAVKVASKGVPEPKAKAGNPALSEADVRALLKEMTGKSEEAMKALAPYLAYFKEKRQSLESSLKWFKKNDSQVFASLLQEVKTCRQALGGKFMEMRKGFGQNRRGSWDRQALIAKFKEKYPKEFEALQQLVKEERQASRKEGKGHKKGKGKGKSGIGSKTEPPPAMTPDSDKEDTE